MKLGARSPSSVKGMLCKSRPEVKARASPLRWRMTWPTNCTDGPRVSRRCVPREQLASDSNDQGYRYPICKAALVRSTSMADSRAEHVNGRPSCGTHALADRRAERMQ